MKKSVIFIVLLVSVVFVVILLQDKYGCGKENRDQCLLKVVEEEVHPKLEICDEISAPENKNICYFTLAQKNENGSAICKLIQPGGAVSRDYCYYSLALSKKNLSLCQEVSSEEQKQLCTRSLALSGFS
jgi:hypothetical protein